MWLNPLWENFFISEKISYKENWALSIPPSLLNMGQKCLVNTVCPKMLILYFVCLFNLSFLGTLFSSCAVGWWYRKMLRMLSLARQKQSFSLLVKRIWLTFSLSWFHNTKLNLKIIADNNFFVIHINIKSKWIFTHLIWKIKSVIFLYWLYIWASMV